jgi:hypothetical protein
MTTPHPKSPPITSTAMRIKQKSAEGAIPHPRSR